MKWEYKTLDQLGTVSRGKSKHRPRNDPKLFGGKYPFIQTADVKNADVVIPDKETLEKFDKCAKTYFNKIKTLQGQNERLKTARNLLLPKLMNGKVEV